MNYVKIDNFDTANGLGIGLVLWVSGCEHHCKGCHNPETWNKSYGEEFTEESMNNLIDSLSPSYISRLTFSGGDPLAPYNRDTITRIAKTIKSIYPNKSIWLYTGYTYEDISDLPIFNYIDVLVDGQFQINNKNITLPYCGSTNQRLIDVRETMGKGDLVLYELKEI